MYPEIPNRMPAARFAQGRAARADEISVASRRDLSIQARGLARTPYSGKPSVTASASSSRTISARVTLAARAFRRLLSIDRI
jgi:hypothetical protein